MAGGLPAVGHLAADRYPLSNPAAGELVAPRAGLVDVKAHSDTAYYTSFGGGPIGMFTGSTKAPIAVTPQRVGLLSLETRKVDTLIQDAGKAIASGTARAGVFWFLGAPGPILFKLTR